jgi:hypothetical protein
MNYSIFSLKTLTFIKKIIFSSKNRRFLRDFTKLRGLNRHQNEKIFNCNNFT